VTDIRKTARWAGLLYFMTLILGPIGLIYVPTKIFVRGDPAATAEHIRAMEPLLRMGIAVEMIGQLFLVYAVLVLYRLFKPVNDGLARQMLVLGALLPTPIFFVNLLNELAALALAGGANVFAAFGQPQLDALAYLFMQLHGRGFIVSEVFWGLWLYPFGFLVIRSGFIPKLLGWLLMIAGTAYVADCFVWVLWPQFSGPVGSVARLMQIGEVPIIFWLLIWGARIPPPASPPSTAA
jgi:hypothetical protein